MIFKTWHPLKKVVWGGTVTSLLMISPEIATLSGSHQQQPTSSERIQVSEQVLNAIRSGGRARVLVTLRDPAALTAQDPERSAAVSRIQNSTLDLLPADSLEILRKYTYVPGFAAMISSTALELLRANPSVVAIQMDEPGAAHLTQSVPALGANTVHSTYHLTGQGVIVAVLDSGIDTDHPDLSDDLTAQHCFTNGDCPPSNTNEGTSAEDEWGHGSNVSGIITSRGTVSSVGFAPNAKIVAVRVLDANGSGWVSDWIKGLDWVRANLSSYPVKVVNMSLGTYALYTGNCDVQQSLFASSISQLNALGVTIFASTGNQGSVTQIASPACNSGVIAVGATFDSNLGREPDSNTWNGNWGGSWPACFNATTSLQTIVCFTNSNSTMDIVAPGVWITGPYPGGGTEAYAGTSQASPTAAGIAALLLQARPQLTPSQIENFLKSTGTPLTDPKNGLQFPLINALSAVQAALKVYLPLIIR